MNTEQKMEALLREAIGAKAGCQALVDRYSEAVADAQMRLAEANELLDRAEAEERYATNMLKVEREGHNPGHPAFISKN